MDEGGGGGGGVGWGEGAELVEFGVGLDEGEEEVAVVADGDVFDPGA